jgi:hypothetical protein
MSQDLFLKVLAFCALILTSVWSLSAVNGIILSWTIPADSKSPSLTGKASGAELVGTQDFDDLSDFKRFGNYGRHVGYGTSGLGHGRKVVKTTP